MEDFREKPGPKPFPWNPEMGPIKNDGLKAPVKYHAMIRKDSTKALLEKMALNPDFEIQVLGLVEK